MPNDDGSDVKDHSPRDESYPKCCRRTVPVAEYGTNTAPAEPITRLVPQAARAKPNASWIGPRGCHRAPVCDSLKIIKQVVV